MTARPASRPDAGVRAAPRRREAARGASPRDVRAVLRDGAAAHGSAMVVRVLAGGHDGQPGTAVVASRRLGGAVDRNRAKRRLREALRLTAMPSSSDVVVIARAAALTMPFDALCAELDALLRRATGRAERETA